MKRCPRCDRWLERSAFTVHRNRPDGLQPFCRECQRGAVRDHYWANAEYYRAKASRRQSELLLAHRAALAPLKASACTDCGRVFPPCAMDFDHVRGDKRFNIADAWMRGKGALHGELAKCELVCSNCHRERTQRRRSALRQAMRTPE